MGSVHGLLGGDDSNTHLLTDPVSQTEDEEGGFSRKILYKIQGVVNPKLFRKVVLAEAFKFGQKDVVYGEPGVYNPHKEDSVITDLITKDVQTSRSQSSSQRISYSSYGILPGASSFTFGDTLLHKFEEVEHSVKKIEAMVEHSQSLEAFPRSTS